MDTAGDVLCDLMTFEEVARVESGTFDLDCHDCFEEVWATLVGTKEWLEDYIRYIRLYDK